MKQWWTCCSPNIELSSTQVFSASGRGRCGIGRLSWRATAVFTSRVLTAACACVTWTLVIRVPYTTSDWEADLPGVCLRSWFSVVVIWYEKTFSLGIWYLLCGVHRVAMWWPPLQINKWSWLDTFWAECASYLLRVDLPLLCASQKSSVNVSNTSDTTMLK